MCSTKISSFAQRTSFAMVVMLFSAAAWSADPAATVAPPTVERTFARFQQQPASPGDRVVQQLGVQLELATKIIQSGQTAHESTSAMRREQDRTIEVLEVREGRAVKAKATFDVSRRQSPESATPTELVTQPIEGKSYLMSRDGEKLVVTDMLGNQPPEEELKAAIESLENVGKPNPLASLLVGRRIAVGELIRVPRDMVQPLLGLDEAIGSVHRFELRLVRVEPASEEHPAPWALFETDLEIRPNDSSPMAIKLHGEMAIETDTCRLTEMKLDGPVGISSIERTEGGIFQFTAGGELKMAIRSDYGRAVR